MGTAHKTAPTPAVPAKSAPGKSMPILPAVDRGPSGAGSGWRIGQTRAPRRGITKGTAGLESTKRKPSLTARSPTAAVAVVPPPHCKPTPKPKAPPRLSSPSIRACLVAFSVVVVIISFYSIRLPVVPPTTHISTSPPKDRQAHTPNPPLHFPCGRRCMACWLLLLYSRTHTPVQPSIPKLFIQSPLNPGVCAPLNHTPTPSFHQHMQRKRAHVL